MKGEQRRAQESEPKNQINSMEFNQGMSDQGKLGPGRERLSVRTWNWLLPDTLTKTDRGEIFSFFSLLSTL